MKIGQNFYGSYGLACVYKLAQASRRVTFVTNP
jgi:hypothetical protein